MLDESIENDNLIRNGLRTHLLGVFQESSVKLHKALPICCGRWCRQLLLQPNIPEVKRALASQHWDMVGAQASDSDIEDDSVTSQYSPEDRKRMNKHRMIFRQDWHCTWLLLPRFPQMSVIIFPLLILRTAWPLIRIKIARLQGPQENSDKKCQKLSG